MASENRVLGRGKVFFAPYALNQRSGGLKGYLGNTPTLSLTVTTTKLDHFSSEGGLKIKDLSIVLQEDMMLTFDTDNISQANLALWFSGNSNPSQPTDAPTDIGTISFSAGNTAIFGALFFESDNPVGNNLNAWFPYVSLTPTGALTLKGDAWQQFGFQAECLKRDNVTDRAYFYTPSGGSTAAADTTPYLSVADATVPTTAIATGGTVTATTPQVHAVPFTTAFTLTGGKVGYIFANDGTNNVAGPFVLLGASGTSPSITLPAGTYTLKLHALADGSDAALATSASITVS